MKYILPVAVLLLIVRIGYCQNNAPVAVPDTATTMHQVPVEINVLLNDYDPDGDAFEIYRLYYPVHGLASFEDSIVTYISRYKFKNDSVPYNIRESGNPQSRSEDACIRIKVTPNPDVPVAVPDSAEVLQQVTTPVYVLDNDHDDQGDELKIKIVDGYSGDQVLSEDSTYILFTSNQAGPPAGSTFRYAAAERSTGEGYYSDWAKVYVTVLPNPDVPEAVDDEANTTGGYPISIPVLMNDIDPVGLGLEILGISSVHNGNATDDGSNIFFTPDISFRGITEFVYKNRNMSDPYLYSDWAKVRVTVEKNPDCPVALPDSAGGIAFQEILLDVMTNDYDPNGDPIELMDVRVSSELTRVSISGDMILYISSPLTKQKDTIYYRVRQVSDTLYYSEWTPVYITLTTNPALPVANADEAEVLAGWPVEIPVLENDDHSQFDSVEIISARSLGNLGRLSIEGTSVTYHANANASGMDTVLYRIRGDSNFYHIAESYIYIDILDDHTFDSLDVNNISAGVLAHGGLFSYFQVAADYNSPEHYRPVFEYPSGSGKHTIFLNTFWIGGMNENDTLHLAADKYRFNGGDFQAGPVADHYDSVYRRKYDEVWKLDRAQVDHHRQNWWKAGYEPIGPIATWPGNGNAANGEADVLAPFGDLDNDGTYDPYKGDYPLLRGDQTVFFMCNDDKEHEESGGIPLKIELHGMVYGFDAPGDSMLNNTVFLHLDLINRSGRTYRDTYTGILTDFQIGYEWDNYLGSDVNRGFFFGYNGKDIDGAGHPQGYGENPPAQSVIFLSGPFMDPDGQDNPDGQCDFSVNGSNFGNGIPDDERYGMVRFTRGNPFLSLPEYPPEYYHLLTGKWPDGQPFFYGGSGHPSSEAVGPACRFLYPGDSDPMNWGTGCGFPNAGYNQDGKYWTEEEAGFNPDYRRGLGVTGPFTFNPGDVQEIEMAYQVARGDDGAWSSVVRLKEYADSLRSMVAGGSIVFPNNELGLAEPEERNTKIHIYPNPVSTLVHFVFPHPSPQQIHYDIFDVLGHRKGSGILPGARSATLSVADLPRGLYIVMIRTGRSSYIGKFIKL